MPEKKILLDTNAYLRLAVHFHPLLRSLIPGENGGELWILAELYQELQRNPSLRNQFQWTFEPEFVENRKSCRWRLSEPVRREIQSTFDFSFRYSQTIENSASPFDIQCLAYGLVLGIRVVTDDQEMLRLARDLEIGALSTLELAKIMVESGYCDMEKIRSLVRYWIAEDDLPGQYRSTFKRLFNEAAPSTAY